MVEASGLPHSWDEGVGLALAHLGLWVGGRGGGVKEELCGWLAC